MDRINRICFHRRLKFVCAVGAEDEFELEKDGIGLACRAEIRCPEANRDCIADRILENSVGYQVRSAEMRERF